MSQLSMCTGLRRPKVFRDITYFVNTIVDNKLSIDNFCTQTSLLCLEHNTFLALDESFNLFLTLIGLGKLLEASA